MLLTRGWSSDPTGCGYDNFIHCLEAKDGKLLWNFETMNYINGTPAVWGKEAVVFGGCDAQLYVISLLDVSHQAGRFGYF